MWLPPIKTLMLNLFSILHVELNVSATDTKKHDGEWCTTNFQQHQTGKKCNCAKSLE